MMWLRNRQQCVDLEDGTPRRVLLSNEIQCRTYLTVGPICQIIAFDLVTGALSMCGSVCSIMNAFPSSESCFLYESLLGFAVS